MINGNINWQPHLEDGLVKLVPLTAGDFDILYAVASDPAIWEQHPEKNRYEKEVFQPFFDSAVEGRMAFLIVDKVSGRVIGSTRYYFFPEGGTKLSIGYTFLAKAFWGGTYNRACKKLLLDHAFQYADRIYLHIGSTNIRSQIATTRIGAVKTGEFETDSIGRKRLNYEYVIEKTEWERSLSTY